MVAIQDYSTTLEKLEEYEENRPLRDSRYYKEGFTVETEIVKIWIVGSKM
jgi:predicted methyltransferase